MIRSSVAEGSTTEGVGARLKRLRLQRGFSQRDLSSPGVSYAYISRIEAGARTPSVKALRKLAQKLNVSVEYLETGREIRDVDDRELRLADAELQLRLDSNTDAAEVKLK
jgi:transcriptional regulator with XRE-family HTH domain